MPDAYRSYLEAYPQGAHAAEAQFNLGRMYETAHGVAQDYAQAMQWYRKAAQQGSAPGQRRVGWMYDNGFGVARDDAEAVRWYRLAAEQGDPDSENNLGVMYRDGRGVAQDAAQAIQWFRKAAEQGNIRAQQNLQAFSNEQNKWNEAAHANTVDAYRSYLEAYPQGTYAAEAYLRVGTVYAIGVSPVSRDQAQAVQWYRKAVERGSSEAQQRLQNLCARGVTQACS